MAERFRQQVAILDVVGDEDQPRRRLVVIELREEGSEYLAGRNRPVGLGEISAIAPVLTGAEEEHLNAGKAALLVKSEDIGFLDAARVDALMRLNGRERRQAIAVDRGAFEIERQRRLLHFSGEFVLYRLAAPRQERIRFAHEHRVFAEINLVGARRRATLDLVQEARPCTAFEERVAARAQQKRAL